MDVTEVLGLETKLLNGEVTARQLDTIGQKGDTAAKLVAAGFSKADMQLIKMMQDVQQMQRQFEAAGATMSRMSAPAVTGFRQMAVAEQEAVATTVALNREIEATHAISHSAVIGVGELARGIGRVAESGQLGAFAMREFSGSAMRLGGALGPLGGLAGIVVLLGGVIVETFTKARHEMEETRKKFEEEIATMANAAQASDLNKRMRDLLYGQPFDQKNQLSSLSKYAAGAFQGSIADLEAHYAALQAQIPRDATMAPAKIADEWNQVVKALDAARTQYAQLRTAALNVANQPADMGGLLPVVTTEKIIDAQRELEAQAKFTAASMDRITKSLQDSQPEWTLNAKQYETTINLLKILNEQETTLVKVGERNAKAGADQVNAAAESIKQAMKYSDDMSKIWRDGIAKITTDGFKSFLDFAEDLNQLFTKLMDRMAERARQLGKEAGGAGYTALGIGISAISGGIAGYQSGNAGVGALGGALAGSAFGAPGIFIGALAGLTGGLLGGAKAAKERRAAEEELTRQYNASINSIRNQVGDLSDLDFAKAQVKTQSDALRAQALQLYGNDSALNKYFGTTLTRLPDALKQIQELEDKRIKQLEDEAAAAKETAAAAERLKNYQSQQNSQLRIYNATGQSDAAFALQQSLEIQQAIADGLDAISIALLKDAQNAERAQREREKQTQILQDQLSTAQQAYDTAKQTFDSLSQFSDSLKVGQYSPLSPRQQLDAARSQLGVLYQAALGGDANSAQQFGGVAQQFLDASRKYNASGAGYVLDYNSVTVMTDALKNVYGLQMTDAQKQVSLLQQQLDVLKSIDQGTQVLVSRPNLTPQVPTPTPVGGTPGRLQPVPGITADDVASINARLDALVAVSQAGFTGTIAATQESTAAVEENTTLTTRKLDSLTAATANRRTA